MQQTLPIGIKHLFIIDTNFIISHLSIVKKLVEEYASSKALVLIPWIVIQELDGLKSASSSYGQANLATLSRSAVRYIYECLSNGIVGLRGQKIVECLRPGQTGDDSILDCARYWTEKQNVPVVLLSNDKNLCTKMMIHSIGAISHELGLSASTVLQRAQEICEVQAEQSIQDHSQAVPDGAQMEYIVDDEMTEHEISSDGCVMEYLNPVGMETTNTGLAEMQTDPILTPLVNPKSSDDPFAILSAKAGMGRFERTTRVLPVHGASPDRIRPGCKDAWASVNVNPIYDPENQEHMGSIVTDGSQDAARAEQNEPMTLPSQRMMMQPRDILFEMEYTILRTFPDLILGHLINEFEDEDAATFLLGDYNHNPTVSTIAQTLSDNWMTCFAKLFPSYDRFYDTSRLKILAKTLEQTLKRDQGYDNVRMHELVIGWSDIWRGLSVAQTEKYRRKRDRTISRWLQQTTSPHS